MGKTLKKFVSFIAKLIIVIVVVFIAAWILNEYFDVSFGDTINGFFTKIGGWGVTLIALALGGIAFMIDPDAARAMLGSIGDGITGLVTAVAEVATDVVGSVAKSVFSSPFAIGAAVLAGSYLLFKDSGSPEQRETVIVAQQPQTDSPIN